MRFNQDKSVPSKTATTITHNVNLSFEIGTSHIGLSETTQRITEEVQNGGEARASTEDINGKSQDISHGNNREMRSGYSSQDNSNLGNPHGIRPDLDCVGRIQEDISSDNSSGGEAIAQHVKTIGKPQGISHATRMAIIADPALVPRIHSGVKRTADTAHIDTNEKVLMLMHESYPEDRHDYANIHNHELMAISILLTGMVPLLDRFEKIRFRRSITILNTYRRSAHIPEIPANLLSVEYNVLVPVFFARSPSSRPITEYASNLREYKERLRLMSIECDVIDMITNGIIPKMSVYERNQLNNDLLVINEDRDVDSEPLLDINKSFDDHFPPDPTIEVDSSSDSSDTDEDDILFGTNATSSWVQPNSMDQVNTRMQEAIAKHKAKKSSAPSSDDIIMNEAVTE